MDAAGRHARRSWVRLIAPLVVQWLVPAALSAAPLDDCQLSVHWKVLANRGEEFDAELTLSNAGPGDLPTAGWRIYFNSARLLKLADVSDTATLRHVNGDFFELSPGANFKALAPGGRCTFSVNGANWAIKKSDAPAGFYVVGVDQAGRELDVARPLKATIAPFVTPQQTKRSPGDNLWVPTAASRFASNPPSTPMALSARDLVVPTPVSVVAQPGEVRIDSSTVVAYSPGLEATASLLVAALHDDVGVEVRKVEGLRAGRNFIRLQGSSRKNEAYSLEINEHDGIDVVGQGGAGVYYGVQTLRALLPIKAYRSRPGALNVGCIAIRDAPRFAYRGLHLDVARNFHGVDTVKKLLDLMGFYKLNRLHWHLTDDEGWRLEIKAYPELTAIGGRRGHTVGEKECLIPSLGSGPTAAATSPGCGYYTQDEFVEILRYAAARHIEVIPEFDFPGHARAAIKSLQARSARLGLAGDVKAAESCLVTDPLDQSKYESVQLWHDNVVDVGLGSTYLVLETIFDEVVDMYRRAGAPLTTIHIGGDEVPDGVWQKSPACLDLVRAGVVKDSKRRTLHAYFVNRVAAFLNSRELRTACWEESVLAEEERDGKIVKRPAQELLHQKPVAYVWNNVWGWGQEDVAYRLANAGFDVVLCNATNLYFDLAYDKDSDEPGYYWAGFVDERKPFEFMPLDFYKNAHTDSLGNRINQETYAKHTRLTSEGVRHVLGIQGQLWSETLSNRERLEYAAFPKVIALAERAWAAQPAWENESNETNRKIAIDKDWRLFANRLGQRELARLDSLAGGVNYRIPPPGAIVVDGRMQANTAYPTFAIRYEMGDAPPTKESTRYQAAFTPGGVTKLKAFGWTSRFSRTTTAPD